MHDKEQPKKRGRLTMQSLQKMYGNEEKITAITAYDYTMARMLDAAGVDVILVGDSMGMVIQGHDTTLPVEFEHVLYHTQCVARGVERAHVMADMPFLSYQVNHEEAVRNAGELVKVGAQSVKLEGGEEIGDLVWYLNQIGIPTVAHIGLRPQCVNTMGGYKIQGKSKAEADNILNDAYTLEEAGASMLLLEGVPLEVAKEISENVKIPTLGIASGPHCSGQILVCYDLLGANPDFSPKFARKYGNMFEDVTKAVSQYVKDVRGKSFPAEAESFHRNLVEVKSNKKEK